MVGNTHMTIPPIKLFVPFIAWSSGLDNMARDENETGVCFPRAWVAFRRAGCRATGCGTRAPNNE
jgi:hypothetical protein